MHHPPVQSDGPDDTKKRDHTESSSGRAESTSEPSDTGDEAVVTGHLRSELECPESKLEERPCE